MELAPDRERRVECPPRDGRSLHIHAEQALAAVGREDRHGMTMADQRLRRHDEACEVAEILGRTGDDGFQLQLRHQALKLLNNCLAHVVPLSRHLVAFDLGFIDRDAHAGRCRDANPAVDELHRLGEEIVGVIDAADSAVLMLRRH
jgi:hypothetical protein